MADIAPSVPGFFDGFGDRLVVTDRAARALEVLRVRPELVADPRFEPAVRARADLLTRFQHAGCTHVRHVGRLPGGDGRLALVSDFVTGWRLSEVLQATEQLNLQLHTNAVLFLLRQLVSVVSQLHALGPDVSHGALGPERVVVTPTGRLVVMEHVLGTALPFIPSISPQRAWRDLRLAVAADDPNPFGQRTDVLQVGLCGVALVLSRPLRLDDYPHRLRDLLDRATESKLTGERRPLRAPLRSWLEQALGLTPGSAALTLHDVREGLDHLVSREGYLATPTGLVNLMQSVEAYVAGDLAPEAPTPAAAPASPRESATPGALGEEMAAEDERPAPVAEQEAPVAPLTLARTAIEALPVHDVDAPAPVSVLRATEKQEFDPEALDLAPGPRPVWPTAVPTADEERSFAPEPGCAFTPEDDDPLPAEPRAPSPWSGTVPTAQAAHDEAPALLRPAASPAQGPPSGPQDTIRVRRPASSGAFAAVPPPPLAPVPRPSAAVPVVRAEPAVEPLASSVDEDWAGPSRGTPAAEAKSGAVPRAGGSLFGMSHGDDTDEALPAGPSNVRWIAAAAVGCLALVGMAGGWALMGSGEKPASPAAVTRGAGGPREDLRSDRSREPQASRSADPASPAAAAPDAPAAAAPVAVPAVPMGELRVVAPFPVEVFEGGVKVGVSGALLQLPAGRHRLELMNADLQFRSVAQVEVQASRRVRVQPAIPQGTANINASPWAEVWIDGERAGETPLGNLALPIGSHHIVFKHPQLGEQSRTLIVTAIGPARLSVEMKQ